jgi:hypothetical protein
MSLADILSLRPAKDVIPWFKDAFVRDGQSVLKGRWLAIRRGNKVCYAQWEDCCPFFTDHWQYVFGNERPKANLRRPIRALRSELSGVRGETAGGPAKHYWIL